MCYACYSQCPHGLVLFWFLKTDSGNSDSGWVCACALCSNNLNHSFVLEIGNVKAAHKVYVFLSHCSTINDIIVCIMISQAEKNGWVQLCMIISLITVMYYHLDFICMQLIQIFRTQRIGQVHFKFWSTTLQF